MVDQDNIDPQRSDKIKDDDDEIIELTEVVEVKPQESLEKDISPDDFFDEEGFDLSDDGDMAEIETQDLPEPAVFSHREEPQEDEKTDTPEIDDPMGDGSVDLDSGVSDLGVLVSEITGSPLDPDPGEITAPLPGFDNLTTAQLDMAVERAVEKIFKEKIETKIMALFEAVVKREIDKITAFIEKQAKED